MPGSRPALSDANRLLVKLRPSGTLRVAEGRTRLRPLSEPPPGAPGSEASALGLAGEPRWYIADLPEGAATPWDLAHARVADQLGVAESDVIFAEPDINHSLVTTDPNEPPPGQPFAVGDACDTSIPQDRGHGKAAIPDTFAWHLGDAHSQLAKARAAVEFSTPRTRIAHLDTGYYPAHVTTPRHVARELERNFVARDRHSTSAADPDNRLLLLDNSGHGTGTIGILAGGPVPGEAIDLGGAPDAEVLPLRIADSVVLLGTAAFAEAIHYAVDTLCDVVTMSMGGLPSRAWNDAINRAYQAGVCIVAAAGNNASGLPTRNLVYPARYARVIAACGVMADQRPYHQLAGVRTLEGNYGPDSVMASAVAAYTPNVPWPRFGCADAVRLNGEGTSAATPQVAAAVALWFERYKRELPRDWRRVEAVRHALFTSARRVHRRELGQGILKAFQALAVRPMLGLPATRPDSDRFAFLRVLTGLGIADPPPREQMFNLELTQRWLVNPELQRLVPDPESMPSLDEQTLKQAMDAIIEDEGASLALRRHVAARYPVLAGRPAPRSRKAQDVVPDNLAVCDVVPEIGTPPYRRLRVYAVDPSLSTQLETAAFNEVTLHVRWEPIEGDGPVGEYLRIEDVDAAGKRYPGVNLNDPRLLAQDGWAPSEGNPNFHQQMVYAVAMKTIDHFEQALGRPVLWRPRPQAAGRRGRGRAAGAGNGFVRQLTVKPHALRQANAYYSPQDVSLLFGYFEAGADHPERQVPGSRVYSCLSHDIIAHETTHAVLDGMFRRFNEPSNPDVLALHEAFADIVALLQHFTMPEVLVNEVARTRGDIEAESILGSLALQFGFASGGRGALREAIGRIEHGVWRRFEPDPSELQRRLTPHARGAILVAAVFDAFLAIYRARTADLLRLSTGGTGVLPEGSIHPDLVKRLASEAAKTAGHVLRMCIRALDYLPPVDVTFFEYLRAVITADFDLVRDDRYHYRIAFVEAFRRRGIYPVNLSAPSSDTPRTLSVDTLRWQGIHQSELAPRIRTAIDPLVQELRRFANDGVYLRDRQALFEATEAQRARLQRLLGSAFGSTPALAAEIGIDPRTPFEVHGLRTATRTRPDGRTVPQAIVLLTQARPVAADPDTGTPPFTFRGGSTLVVDLTVPEITYRISKKIDSATRAGRTAEFVRQAAADPLRALFFSPERREPFAILHTLADEGL